ncbi:MAG: AarF/ABC1/UbiB kinase family protein, partial [Clostridia bacterium]|nr:AarF/ABC1/UbiB kinase family protein [Clostridia bacterium]
KIDDIAKLKEQNYDLDDLGRKLCENYVKQIFDDAFFHADPHPGNIFVEDGKIAWIDLGMVGKLDDRTKNIVNSCIKYVVIGDIDLLLGEVLKLCPPNKETDLDLLRQDISFLVNKYINMDLKDMDMGEIIAELLSCISSHQLKIPANLTMFSRGVLTIEDVIAKLSPNVNLLEIVKSHLGSSFSPLNLKQEALKMGKDVYRSIKKSLAIPAQIGQILDMQIKGKNKLIHEITPSKQFVELQNKKIFQIALIVFANIFLIMSSVFMIFANTIQYLMTMGIIGYIISFILWCMFLYSVFHKKRK